MSKSLLDEFIAYLEKQVENHSIYVLGSQGQQLKTLTKEWINKMEDTPANADRAIAKLQKEVAAGYGDRLRAFDCSGLGMYFLQNLHKLAGDMNANGMMNKCEKIKRSELKRGDWVFVCYTSGTKKGNAHHIGYVVDDELNIIESKGRDDGVIKRPLAAGNWNAYGRPICFFPELRDAWKVFRVLKVTKPLMRGDDIKELQLSLINAGYSCGISGADGVFGNNTAYAVRRYQAANRLVVDGKAGKYTITALGGIWNG